MHTIKTALFAGYRHTRKVSMLVSKVIATPNSPAPIWIHEVSKDIAKGESEERYTARSFGQYIERMHPSLGGETKLALVHLSTTSERLDLTATFGNTFEMYGGHIVFALAELTQKSLSILPDGYMSKGFEPYDKSNGKPKDAIITDGDGQVKILKNEDYQRKVKFDENSDHRIERFLVSHRPPRQAVEYGSKQYLVVFPLKVLGLNIEHVIENIKQYREHPFQGAIYDRMNGACTQAVVASVGIKRHTKGLATQEALMQIAKLIEAQDKALYHSFIKNALAIGLALPPGEVYDRHIRAQKAHDAAEPHSGTNHSFRGRRPC